MKRGRKPKNQKKQQQPEKFERIEARHDFSDEEKLAMLSALAKHNQDVESLTAEAKSSAKGWKNRIESVELQIKIITNNASNGYEMRPTECRVEFDPKKGKKTYYRKDDGTEVETRDMLPSDYEVELPLPDPKPGEPLNNVGDAFKQAEEADSGQAELGAD